MKKHLSIDQIDQFKSSWELQEHVLAPQVLNFETLSSIQKDDLILLSLSESVGSNVRYKWYGFSQFTSTRIVDCGTYNGNDVMPLLEFIDALWKKGAVIMLLSENMDSGLYHHLHTDLKEQISISASITRAPSDTVRLYPKTSFVSIANQVHRSKPFHLMKSENLVSLRLGELRSYFAEAEPFMRHADCGFFDFSSVRFADAPGQTNPSTSGLTSEECCHLARYAGQASKLKLFWIYNYAPEYDTRNVTADLTAQMLWYFVDGLEHRKDAFPLVTTNMQAYVVEFDKLDIPLTFYKSVITDRWWVAASFNQDAHPTPCSKRDYDLAKQGELSPRLLALLDVYG